MPGSTNYSMNPTLWENATVKTPEQPTKQAARPMTEWEKSLVKSMTMPVTKVTPIQKKSTWVATNANINKGVDSYTVRSGNTLGQIVADYNKKNNTNLKWQDVAKWSGIEDVNKMKIGHVVRFTDPNASQKTTSDTDSKTSAAPQASTAEVVAPVNNGTSNSDSITVKPQTTANSLLVGDSVRATNPIIDSLGVVPADTGMVFRNDSNLIAPIDSALTTSADSTTVSAATPAFKSSSPKNFTGRMYYFSYPTEDFMRQMQYQLQRQIYPMHGNL